MKNHYSLILHKPSFYWSAFEFKKFHMLSYQSVVNINIIMKFLIGHKAFFSLCTLSRRVPLSLTIISWSIHTLKKLVEIFLYFEKFSRMSTELERTSWIRGHVRRSSGSVHSLHNWVTAVWRLKLRFLYIK